MTNKSNLFPKYPTIGESVEEFTKFYGQPLKENNENSMLNRYIIDIEGASYLLTANLDNIVNNISFSLTGKDESNWIGVDLFSNQMIPVGAKLVKKIENKVIPLINADDPISIYEYYSDSIKDSKGYLEDDNRGYITKYLSVVDGVASFTVALGKEPLIQE